MLASPSVSLPSIHEMFPDHLIHSDDQQQRPRSHRGNTYPQPTGVHRAEGCPCSHHDCPRSGEDIRSMPPSSARRRSSASTASSSSHSHPQNIYAFNVLRSSPSHTTPASPSGSGAGTGVGAKYYDNYGQDARSAYPSPSDAYTQQQTRGSVEGRDPNASFPVSRSTGPLPLPPSASSSTQHRQQYRSPPSHADAEDDDDGNASGAEDNDTSNGKKHVCTTCFKRFNRPSSLRIHVNTHTGATPFRCPWPNCGREFNVNSNMRRHYRNHTTPGFSRSSSSSQQTPSSTANGNPQPNLPPTGAITNSQVDGRRKRRRVSVPIPPAQISATEASANRGVPPDSGYPHPHAGYRGEYTYTYRHPGDPHYQQGIPPRSEFSPPSPFSSRQSHHPHAYTHNEYGHGHRQYANNGNNHSRSYPHPQTQRYLNAESVMPSPPISNLSMSEEDESSSGSGDESDNGIGGFRRGKVDDEGEDEGEEGDGDEYDERGYRTRVGVVHGRTHAHAHHPYSHTRTSYTHTSLRHPHHDLRERDRGSRENRESAKYQHQHAQRPLTPGSSFHSSSPSPSVSPSPPPSTAAGRLEGQRHVVSAERGRAGAGVGQEQGEGQGEGRKYNASTPYVRSLADSRVSTTLRPAFLGAVGSAES